MVRFKNRYLLVEVVFEPPPLPRPSPAGYNQSAIFHAVRDSLQLNFGDYGAGILATFGVRYFNPYTDLSIVRASRDHIRKLWAAVTLVKEIRGVPCIMHVLHAAGTIKKCQEEAIRYDRIMLLKLKARMDAEEDVTVNVAELIKKSEKEISELDG